MTQFDITTSTELSGSGMSSISPFRNQAFSIPAFRLFSFARDSISSVISRPYAFPVGPTRLAESSTSIPPPEPRSRTTSPGLSCASAVGFPQPSEASTAPAGAALEPQQQEEPLPEVTRSACSPYFSLTASLISICVLLSRTLACLQDRLGLDRFVPGAALCIEEREQVLKRARVG